MVGWFVVVVCSKTTCFIVICFYNLDVISLLYVSSVLFVVLVRILLLLLFCYVVVDFVFVVDCCCFDVAVLLIAYLCCGNCKLSLLSSSLLFLLLF